VWKTRSASIDTNEIAKNSSSFLTITGKSHVQWQVAAFSVKGSCIQSKHIPNKTISSTGYWIERWDCPAVYHKMKLGEASRHVAKLTLSMWQTSYGSRKIAGEVMHQRR
jgi:hypothetical protein